MKNVILTLSLLADLGIKTELIQSFGDVNTKNLRARGTRVEDRRKIFRKIPGRFNVQKDLGSLGKSKAKGLFTSIYFDILPSLYTVFSQFPPIRRQDM